MKLHLCAKHFVLSVICLAICGDVARSDDGSLSLIDSEDSNHEKSNSIVALERLLVENRRLRSEVFESRQLAAAATIEAEVFKRQVQAFALRSEALGVASSINPSELEQRILQAVNALRRSESARDKVCAALVRIARIAQDLSKNSDAETRLVLNAELKRVDDVLAKAVVGDLIDSTPKLQSSSSRAGFTAKVSSIKDEIGCIIINVGSIHGIKPGMPFEVRRDDRLIATIRVVDTRQMFSGAVLHKLAHDKMPINIGDAVSVEAIIN